MANDKKISAGVLLLSTAISLVTIYAVVYIAGKAWKKGTSN